MFCSVEAATLTREAKVEKKPKTTTTKVAEPSSKLVSKAKVKATVKPTAQIGQGDDGGGSSSSSSESGGGAVNAEAIATVERKMRWILEQLDATTQVVQISELLDLLQKCQATVEQFRK